MSTSTPRPGDRTGQPADLLFQVTPTISAPPERHWFVPDITGSYCEACGLPAKNRRHAPRAVMSA